MSADVRALHGAKTTVRDHDDEVGAARAVSVFHGSALCSGVIVSSRHLKPSRCSAWPAAPRAAPPAHGARTSSHGRARRQRYGRLP